MEINMKLKEDWLHLLTNNDKEHLFNDANCELNEEHILETFKNQEELRKIYKGSEPCWECKHLMNKLCDK